MKLVWRQTALDDRSKIMDHILLDNPEAAIALDEIFELKAENARLRPTLYRKGKVPGTREIVATANYVMIYLIAQEAVEMVRVIHARQRWP
ncbi:type II toxin-antitoxin system RelE/ParE family toxin [Pseudomonas sp. BIC9C]|uniref:type II toxin-antitoxin system RelE/ParE family toxin n=1 Tax=Pseudomonas sp. BIC9C TaxID=3078458 RepID=UPI002AD26D32|nr:type II toxin-antitoxin system RelE/ParE family toxin [Pseudomonas sp. BIC9C]